MTVCLNKGQTRLQDACLARCSRASSCTDIHQRFRRYQRQPRMPSRVTVCWQSHGALAVGCSAFWDLRNASRGCQAAPGAAARLQHLVQVWTPAVEAHAAPAPCTQLCGRPQMEAVSTGGCRRARQRLTCLLGCSCSVCLHAQHVCQRRRPPGAGRPARRAAGPAGSPAWCRSPPADRAGWTAAAWPPACWDWPQPLLLLVCTACLCQSAPADADWRPETWLRLSHAPRVPVLSPARVGHRSAQLGSVRPACSPSKARLCSWRICRVRG